MWVLPDPTVCAAASGLRRRIPDDGDFFGVWGGQGTCSFVFCVSKEKVGLLAQKDVNADHLITLHSFLLQNKIKESYRSVGGQGNQSPLPSPKPPHHACV